MFNVTEVKRQISSPTYYLALRHLNIYHLLLYRSINWLEILIEMDAELSTLHKQRIQQGNIQRMETYMWSVNIGRITSLECWLEKYSKMA